MVVSALTFVGLSIVVFVGMKFTFWCNAYIFLGLLARKLPRTFWRWNSVEVMLMALPAMSYSAQGMFYPVLRIPNMVISITSFLVWMAYMVHRVWRLSEPLEQ